MFQSELSNYTVDASHNSGYQKLIKGDLHLVFVPTIPRWSHYGVLRSVPAIKSLAEKSHIDNSSELPRDISHAERVQDGLNRSRVDSGSSSWPLVKR